MGLTELRTILSKSLPDGLKKFFKWALALFGHPVLSLMFWVFFISGLIVVSNNMAYYVKYRYYGDEQLKENVEFRKHNKINDSVKKRLRIADSIAFEKQFKKDSIEIEAIKEIRVLRDSIYMLKNMSKN